MLSIRDYFLMADIFREIYITRRHIIYNDPGDLFRTILREFMKMLQKDNPRFRPDYFLNYIIWGECKPKGPSGEAQA